MHVVFGAAMACHVQREITSRDICVSPCLCKGSSGAVVRWVCSLSLFAR